MASELLTEFDLEPRVEELASNLQKGANSLNDILGDILDLSKIESGKIELEVSPISIPQIIDESLSLFRHTIKKKQLELQVQTDKELPDYMIGDSLRIKLAPANLMSHAVKYTREGGISIKVNVEKCSNRNSILHFCITDSGIGIPADKLTTIFEPFAQGDPSITRAFGGTGLGLSISKQLVELMGGRIWAESDAEHTRMQFTVVLDLPDEGKISSSQQAEESETKVTRNPQDLGKVLLAEDDKINRKMISLWLEKLGCSVDAVTTGKEALETLEENTYGMILMDVSMPEVDGLEATREIRKYPEEHPNYKVPIIGITAHVQDEEIHSFIGAGMNVVLKKPFNKNELQALIEEFCQMAET